MRSALSKNALLLPPVATTPSHPIPGNYAFYVDNAGNPFIIDSDGVVSAIGGGTTQLGATVVGVPTQYSTVGEAINAITDATSTKRYVVAVSPGTYAENNPVQLKPYINVVAVGNLGSVDLVASNPNQDMFTGVGNAGLYGIAITGVTGVSNWAVNMATTGNMIIDSVNINNCSNGIQLNNAGGALTITSLAVVALSGTIGTALHNSAGSILATGVDIAATSTVDRIISTSGANAFTTVDILNTFSPNVNIALYHDISSQSFIRNASIVNADTGLFAQNGANVRLGNSAIFQATTYGIHVPDVGTGTTVGLTATNINANALDIFINSASATMFGFTQLIWANTSINKDASVFATTVDLFPGDEGTGILGELHVGKPDRPSESTFGGGDSYTNGMRVYTFDGAVYQDVTSAASSPSGSTVSFPNTSLNTAIYVTTTLENGGDFLKIPGFKYSLNTAYTAPSNPFVIEYWDATAVSWQSIDFMITESSGEYNPLAKDIFGASGSYQTRMSAFLAIATEVDWGKNDDPGIGTDYYWLRIRINDTLTSSPVIEQIKVHSNRTEINDDGFLEFFGRGRPIGRLPWDVGLTSPASASPGNQDVFLSVNLDVGREENLFANAATDRTGFISALPQDTDTSTSIRLRWSVRSTTSGGNIDWVIRWAYSTTGDSVFASSGASPATAPTEQSTSISPAGPANADEETWYQTDLDISNMVSRRSGGDPDTLWVTIERTSGDTHTGDVALMAINANYLRWCVGGHY